MREALIAFLIALVVGSVWNGMQQMTAFDSDTGASGGANPPAVQLVDESSFEAEVLNADKPVLVDFYTDDNPHCKATARTVAFLAQRLEGDVKVVRVDTQTCPNLVQKYGVGTVPDFAMFKHGEKVDSTIGEQDEQELMDYVQKYVDKPTGGKTSTTTDSDALKQPGSSDG